MFGEIAPKLRSNNIKTINVQTFSASGTYYPSQGMQFCIVHCVGGGGGGGGAIAGSGSSAGGGGGAGGYCYNLFTINLIGTSQSITIGSAGSAGTAGTNNGGNGGNTTFGNLLTSNGGNGGFGAANSTLCQSGFGSGASGGSSSGGILNIQGQSGANGLNIFVSASSVLVFGGQGGSCYFGNGAQGLNPTGSNGTGYGSGGSGAASTSSSNAGGSGKAGLIQIIEFCSI